TAALHTLVAHLAGDFTYGVVTLLAGLGYLMWVDWRMTLLILAIWMVVLLIVNLGYVKQFSKTTDEFSAAQTELAAATVEMAQGVKEIKNFQGAEIAHTRFDAARDNFSDISYRWMAGVGRTMAISMSFLSPAVIFATVAPIAWWFVANGWAQTAQTIPFFLISLGTPKGLMQLLSLMQHLYEARQSAHSTADLMSIAPMAAGCQGEDDPVAALDIAFEDVTFGYDPAEPVVQHISLQLPAGSVTALVGPSGGGKTTLARLLARFYDVDHGTIRIGGYDIRDVSSRWLLSRIALVFQEIALSHDTVHNNIALANPQASREQVIAAAKAACIHERIMELPDGYETVIGGVGGVLSGGEAQRVTIARAYLANAPILILDEATAQADPQSEREIHRALVGLAAGKTVIIIAHRLATVVGADQIAVIDNGRLVACGTHEHLCGADGTYRRLWQAQQQAEIA
ncbi:MAG: ABC transporter ATP-binding protein, partial [Bowdeniella nasicola]|nr:ABC transporter ATP-binding protein [Bowdeniella nasicola]